MGFKIQGNNDDLLQYTAKEQRPINMVRVTEPVYDVEIQDDVILVNQDLAGASTINLYDTINDIYLGDKQVYEGKVRVTDEKGDAATNNIIVKDNDGNTLYVITDNGDSAYFELRNGIWAYLGKMSL